MTDKVRGILRQPMTGYGALVILLVCLSLAGLGVAIGQGNARNVTRVVCEVSGEVVADIHRRLDAYEEAPPSTEAGAAQKAGMEESLRRWESRERALGCEK